MNSEVIPTDHVAILNDKKLLEMILSGEKSIESRWYVNRVAPWNMLAKGDVVYFKLPGRSVTAKATVDDVMQFEKLDMKQAYRIIEKYGREIGLSKQDSKWFKGKNYCILAFLKDPEAVKPFNINKQGYGISSAWMYVKDINKVKEKI